MHVHGLSKIEASHVLAMLAAGMIIGGPLLAYLAETAWGSRKRVLMAACVVLVLLMAVLSLDTARTPGAALYAWFGLLGLVSMGATPLALTKSRDAVDASLSAPATGLCNFIFLMGGAVVPPVAGWLMDVHSGEDQYNAAHYQQTFDLYIVLAVMALAATLVIKGRAAEPTP